MTDATQPKTIPVGILVSVTDSSSRKRARRPRKGVARVPRCQPVPWRELLAAVSAVWLVLIVGVALWAGAASPLPAPAQDPVAAVPAIAPVVNVPEPDVVEPADLVSALPEVRPPLVERLPPAPLPTPELIETSIETKTTPEPKAKGEPLAAPAAPKTCAAKLGTQIDFVADPPEAFRRAKAENKLVFMIHLSGNFEDKEFT